jgi:hypothetical protein
MKWKYYFSLFVLFINCATVYNTSDDYSVVYNHLVDEKPEEAIQNFPTGEKDSFIVTLEKTYLKLLANKIDIEELEWYEKKFENRVRFKISRELKDFFYVDSPDGYYASEHEIIWMHLLLSWAYSKNKEFDKAVYQAKKVSYYLSGEWSREGRFDDPLLRILLGFMWAYAEKWEEAKVDFRVAYNQDRKLYWLQDLINLDTKPETFVLVLGHPGREPNWNPKLEWNLIRGFRDLEFKSEGNRSEIMIQDSSYKNIYLYISPDSSPWYKRHLERDNEINELIQDSKYGQQMALSVTKGAVVSTAGVIGGLALGVASVALGGGLIYLAIECNCGELSGAIGAAGLGVMFWGVNKGYELASETIEYSKDDLMKTADISKKYRYVRFLPDYVWLGFTNDKLTKDLKVKNRTNGKEKNLFKTEDKVQIFIYPDKK